MKRLRLFLASLASHTGQHHLVTPPLGLLYLAGYLRTKFDLDIRVVNQPTHNYTNDDIVRMAVEHDSDIVGFRCLTPSAHHLPELTKKTREALPNALILIGGPHVSAFRGDALEGTSADAAVPGEGELTTEHVLSARFGGGDFGTIPGLIWRTPDGTVAVNPGMMPWIEDLDALPFPAYDLINLKDHWRHLSMAGQVPDRRYMSLFTSRGCPYRCIYCHNDFGKRFRAHSPERIVDEIEYFSRTYGVNDYEFLDDTFNLDPKRVLAFCDLMHRKNLRIQFAFPNAIRGDILTDDVIEALADTGLFYSSMALESGSPRIQELMGKRLHIPRFLDALKKIVARGVYTVGFFMLGFPTETEEEVQQTIDLAVNREFHGGVFFIVTPYPNTELYNMVQRTQPEKLAHVDYRDMEYQGVQMNLSAVPDARLLEMQRKAYLRFYLNPRRVARVLRDHPQRHHLPRYLYFLGRRLVLVTLRL